MVQISILYCYFCGFGFLKKESNFFWRCFIIKQELPINKQIKFKEVQVIGVNGEKIGILQINQAIEKAEVQDLDLVLVSPNAKPPVCKIMNYGKYKFEQAKKEKEARKNQKTVELKEIRVSTNIGDQFIEALSDIATVEKKPLLEGKTMFVILTKNK